METYPACPECAETFTYSDGTLLICPMCAHEWTPAEGAEAESNVASAGSVFKDAVGNTLADGDTVVTTKSLKFKGGEIKAGTKVRGIKLLETPVNGHDIEARIQGAGTMYLKCSVVKKA